MIAETKDITMRELTPAELDQVAGGFLNINHNFGQVRIGQTNQFSWVKFSGHKVGLVVRLRR